MKTITFTSHYNKHEMNIRLTDEKYEKLMSDNAPVELYCLDSDRVASGYVPLVFSAAQIRRLNKALVGIDYWDKITKA